jgi:hypothetical protein
VHVFMYTEKKDTMLVFVYDWENKTMPSKLGHTKDLT